MLFQKCAMYFPYYSAQMIRIESSNDVPVHPVKILYLHVYGDENGGGNLGDQKKPPTFS